jgi:signal transduction histidine kinase
VRLPARPRISVPSLSVPGLSLPKVGVPKIGRPSLRLPWRRGSAMGGPTMLGGAPILHEEDVRILRRTRLRLMAVSGLVTAIILVVLSGAIYGAVSNLVVSDSISRLTDYAELYAPGGPPPPPKVLARQWGTRYAGIFLYEWAVAPDGQVSTGWRTDQNPPGFPYQPAAASVGTEGTDIRDVSTAGVQLRVYTRALQVTDVDGTVYQVYIQTAMDRSQESDLLHLLQGVLVVGSLAALLLALLAGYFYAGRALVPIRASMTRREAALKRQREFAANASHELRTPLTVIGASVEDLKRNRRSKVEDVGEALGDIDAEVDHMTALVEDLLLLARTDSGVVQVEKVPVDLADVAVESVSMLSQVAAEKHVTLELDPLPAFVLGDQLRLRQLVTILTDNAVKHTRPGTTVTVHIQPQPGAALLRVDDQGSGVKPEDLPRIFERFWRADDAPAGGTGLGLSIAKWIVEQHGGTIGVQNRTEGGATFWATIPLWAPSTATSEATIVEVEPEGAPEVEPVWSPNASSDADDAAAGDAAHSMGAADAAGTDDPDDPSRWARPAGSGQEQVRLRH